MQRKKTVARLLRHMFHNSIKQHKPQEIKDAILGSSASSGKTGENTKIVTDNIFGCFLSDRLLFSLFFFVSYQYFDPTFFRSNLN